MHSTIWKKDFNLKEFEQLKGEHKCEVLIIGGGIAGILIAYFLQNVGIDYILVEKDRVSSATTLNTTAKITFQHGLIYDNMINSRGIEVAQKYLDINKKAFEIYEKLCKEIDCNFEYKDNYVYSLNDRKKIENEMRALERIYNSAKLSFELPLPFKTVGAIKFPHQAQFNVVKFLTAIVKNLKIYENTHITELVGMTAKSDNAIIRAKKIIITTHFPFLNKHGMYFLKLYQHRSYVLALKNAANYDGMYVDEADVGYSFRNYGDYLLLGGGDHRTGKEGGNWTVLREFAKNNYKGSSEEFYWAAQDCMSLDGIPYIGQYSKNTPDLFVATGFNKWGMTSSMVAAMILSDLCLEKSNDYIEVFNPSRSILKPQLVLNGLEAIVNLVTPSSKRCPHLGCALKWNKTEHTWDCPCHGSRFTEKGNVLENPANNNLNI